MTRVLSLALLAGLLAATRLAADAAPPDLGTVKDFSLKDCQGQARNRDEWQKARAIVLVFLNVECPVSNGYSPELQRLATEWARQNVRVYGVLCDADVTAEAAVRHATEYQLTFPLLLDPEQTLAQQAGATHAPQAVVLTANGTVRYRGRIDDRWTEEGKRRPQVRAHDLEKAVEAVRNGKAPATAERPVYGCPLPRLPRSQTKEPSPKLAPFND